MRWDQKKREDYRIWRQLRDDHISVRRIGRQAKIRKPNYWIGPANSAGQAVAWSRALRDAGYPATSFRIAQEGGNELFVADTQELRLIWAKPVYRLTMAQQLVAKHSIFLLESLRPIFALNTLRTFTAERAVEDLILLKQSKKRVAVIFHGSDIRDVDHHAQINEFSPYRENPPELAAVRIRAQEARAVIPLLRKKKIPIFITSPDLFYEVPDAIWLPISIDLKPFENIAVFNPAFEHAGPPRVLFLPSKSWIKSGQVVEPILDRLDAEGVITRVRSERVSHDQVAGLLSSCDVVVDQFLGIVGVLPLEAMAAGRLVLSHLDDAAYANLEERPPVIQISPTTLESALRKIGRNADLVAQGRAYVTKFHDGTASVKALRSATTP